MDTTSTPPGCATSSDELKRAGSHLYQAADSTFERVVGSDLRHHVRSAVRHLFRAGVAAIDESERRMRERAARRGHAHERASVPPAACDIAGGRVPDGL